MLILSTAVPFRSEFATVWWPTRLIAAQRYNAQSKAAMVEIEAAMIGCEATTISCETTMVGCETAMLRRILSSPFRRVASRIIALCHFLRYHCRHFNVRRFGVSPFCLSLFVPRLPAVPVVAASQARDIALVLAQADATNRIWNKRQRIIEKHNKVRSNATNITKPSGEYPQPIP